MKSIFAPLFLSVSLPLRVLSAGVGRYTLAKTIPWSPKTATSVDQSQIFNNTYYSSDRTNAVVNVVDLTSLTFKTSITSFRGVALENGVANNDDSGPDGVVLLADRK